MRALAAGAAALVLSACAPSAGQLERLLAENPQIVSEVVEENPEIVFAAIEENPERFMAVVNAAAQAARARAQAEAEQRERAQREREYAHPKRPDLGGQRVYWGAAEAAVTIVEYSDFECPYCARGYRTLKQLLREYPEQVRVLYKHLPLEMHPRALPAALFYEALARQSAEMARQFHDALYENQARLKAGGRAWMEEVARGLGADMKQLEKDLQSEAVRAVVEADMAEAERFGFTGTPGFLINGVSLRGAYPLAAFKEIVDRHLRGE